MELHAFEWQLAVTQAHDDTVLRPRRDFEALRHRIAGHHQRVIARGGERGGQAREDRPAVVADLRHLAVPEAGRTRDLPPESLAQGPVAEADAGDGIAAAFASVSRRSFSGSKSATMPPPA